MKDLFGNEIEDNIKFTLFHDESDCKKSNFLYHGFLFIQNKTGREVLDKIKEIKNNHGREKREIHFNELKQHSQSPNGAKTKIAIDWLDSSKIFLEKNKILFYCFGVNKNNLKNFWTNQNDYKKNVYLRFFEIGLKSAIRWFNLNKITHAFLDGGRHDKDRQKRISWLNFDFLNLKLSHEIKAENTKVLSSDENESRFEFSNLLQLVDVLLGVTRASFIELSISQKGQKECVEDFTEIIERFNNKDKAYNNRSRYYKKFCIGFFPTRNILTKEEFLNNSLENFLKRGSFYCDRETFQQKIIKEKQRKLI